MHAPTRFCHGLKPLAVLAKFFRAHPLSLETWRQTRDVTLRPMKRSDKQEEFVNIVAKRINITDSNDLAGGLSRLMHIAGGPGTGKTETIIHAMYRAAEIGARVLILYPTGASVHAYRERLPATGQIIVETLHNGFSIARKIDLNSIHHRSVPPL